MKAVSKEALSMWRVPYVCALVVGVSFALIYSGLLEVQISLRTADAEKPLEPDIKWGDEFNFWGNVMEWFKSGRGERFIVTAMLCFAGNWVLHLICREIWKKALNPTDYYNISVRDRFFLAQKIPSAMHSIVVGVWSIKLLMIDGLFDDDIINAYNAECDYLFAYSFGYEVYDMLVMYVQTGAGAVMYVHHLSLMIAYLLSATHKKLAFVDVTMLITELTVIPNNLHWYLKTLRYTVTRVFHINYALRMWSFILIRLPAPSYVFYQVFMHREQFYQEVWIARYAVYIIVTLLSMMNVYWTRTMIYLYLNRTTLAEKKKRMAEAAKKGNQTTKKQQ